MLLLFCNSAKSISVSEIVKVDGISYKVTYVNTSGGYFNADVYKSDNSGVVTIPRRFTYEGLTGVVTGIHGSAFRNETDLTKVSIPESVSVIDGGAFYGCRNLHTVVFDGTSRLKTIGYQAFGICNALNTFEIPNSVTTIEQGAFQYCHALTSVTIPSSVQSFGLNTSTSTEAFPAFYHMEGLKAIYVLNPEPIDISEMEFELKDVNNNETIWSIANTVALYVPRGSKEKYAAAKGWNVFTNIVELGLDISDEHVKSICLDKWDTNNDGIFTEEEAAAVTSIGDTFKNNTDIVSLDVLQYFTGLDSISRYAFYGCTNLASVIIPESVDSIFPHAFRDCPSLTSLNIPANVKYINDSAIRNTGITELTVDENNTIYDSRNNCNAVIETSTNTLIVGCNSTVIPDNVVTIGAKAFHSNSFITTIELPNSVTSIQNDVFNGCTSLTEIIIPSGVTDIGSNAFKGCTNLVSVTSLATTPPVAGTGAFKNINSDATLHVPSVSIEEYRKTEPWSNFGSIVALKDGQNNRFIVNDMDVLAGQSFVFPVGMINEIEVTAFQCDVYLPEGITLQTKKGKYDITLDENRKDDHTVTSALQEDGAVRIIVASLNNSIFSETSGILFNLNLIVAEGISATLPITIKNIHISDTSGKETILGDVTANLNVVAYTPGDVNNDGLILVNDVVTAINYILNVTPENFVFAAADMNGDGQILVNDVVQIINTILGVNSAKENGARATITKDADKFYMDDFIIKAGESKQVAIKFDTENVNPANPSELNYVAFQFDLCLPKGLTVVKKKEMYDFKFNDARMGEHTFTSSLQADGSIRVVATSLSNAPFCEKSHDFILFTLTASDDFAGSHKIAIENINFSDKAGEVYKLPVATSRVTDDVVNGISSLDASDNKAIKIYTIDGKCVMKSAIKKGVYIANGKKFYVK